VTLSVPDVVGSTVDVATPHEARAVLVEQLLTVGTAQTPGVPLHVGGDSQYVLVKYHFTASDARKLLLLLLSLHLLLQSVKNIFSGNRSQHRPIILKLIYIPDFTTR